MKGGHRQQPAGAPNAAPLSPTSKATAKYKNKDGSKFITVPKGSTPADSSQGSPTTTPSIGGKAATSVPMSDPAPTTNQPIQPVNRKKQKRREKAAAKAAAEQALKPQPLNGLPTPPPSHEQHSGEAEADLSHDDDEHYPDADSQREYPHQNGYAQAESSKGKKSKKKKKKNAAASADESRDTQSHHTPPGQGRGSNSHHDDRRPSGMSREKIWDNSNAEERERIKEFWLGLSEEERKSLVKVEKDAVLKKMKEQQKHTCSCTVCGRKRTAIEEELEGLYDAYYQELEHYANHPDERNGPPMLRSHQPYGRPRGLHSSYSNSLQPSHGRIVEHVGDDDDEEGDDDYSEDEIDDDDYSDEGDGSDVGYHHGSDYPHDFFNFGNSLTVQGGILTVADDLLKNDGKKFIEMMEQLAERRMAREEDAREQFERNYDHVNGDRHSHAHPPPEEDEDFDDEEDYDDEDEEYDSQDEEEDTMTEEQRMEEGRRMFQIFAARMFEQRVLSAYREKVAKERQAKLIEELEAESIQESQRKAKKAKEAQKRKEKAAKKKQELASQKADREAEKAAQEAARREEEARKAEEQRRKAEEKRKKKEAQKKAEEEERQRKEAERVRRIHEREEAERKAREQKEREKKLREEQRLKEKLAREQKEQELREQKEREAREKREQQEREKREKETKAKAAREIKEAKEKEKKQQEERAAHKAAALAAAAVPVPITLPKRPAQTAPAPVPALPQQQPASYSSPQIPVATPAFPKAPTPMRPRQSSQQESTAAPSSQSGSAPSQNPSPHPLTPVHASPGPIGSLGRSGSIGIGLQGGQQTSHPTSPLNASAKTLPVQPGLYGMPPMGLPYAPAMPSQVSIPPGFASPVPREPMYNPPMAPIYRSAPGLGSAPAGFGGPIGGRGYNIVPPPGFQGPLDSPGTNAAQLFGSSLPRESSQSHSRQNSGNFEPVTPSAASQPISRPTPIGRPSSVVQGQRPSSGSSGNDNSAQDLEPHLGSSALLDDDEIFPELARPQRAPLHTFPPGPAPMMGFPGPFGGIEPVFSRQYGPWGPQNAPQHMMPPVPPPGLGFGSSPMGMSWGPHIPGPPGFGGPALMDRPSEPRAVVMRKLLCRACDQLASVGVERPDGTMEMPDGFVPLDIVKAKLDAMSPDGPVEKEFLFAISETEGDYQNGGGSFEVRDDGNGRYSIRWDPRTGRSNPRPIQRAVGAPGDIGSPVVGGGHSFGNSR